MFADFFRVLSYLGGVLDHLGDILRKKSQSPNGGTCQALLWGVFEVIWGSLFRLLGDMGVSLSDFDPSVFDTEGTAVL